MKCETSAMWTPTSKLPFSSGLQCRASSMSVQPGGSTLQMFKWRRSSRFNSISSVIFHGKVGKHFKTEAENGALGKKKGNILSGEKSYVGHRCSFLGYFSMEKSSQRSYSWGIQDIITKWGSQTPKKIEWTHHAERHAREVTLHSRCPCPRWAPIYAQSVPEDTRNCAATSRWRRWSADRVTQLPWEKRRKWKWGKRNENADKHSLS